MFPSEQFLVPPDGFLEGDVSEAADKTDARTVQHVCLPPDVGKSVRIPTVHESSLLPPSETASWDGDDWCQVVLVGGQDHFIRAVSVDDGREQFRINVGSVVFRIKSPHESCRCASLKGVQGVREDSIASRRWDAPPAGSEEWPLEPSVWTCEASWGGRKGPKQICLPRRTGMRMLSHPDGVNSFSTTQNARLVTGTFIVFHRETHACSGGIAVDDGFLHVWDVRKGQRLDQIRLSIDWGEIISVLCSPEPGIPNRTFAGDSAGSAHITDVERGKLLHSKKLSAEFYAADICYLREYHAFITGVNAKPDTIGDSSLSLWNAKESASEFELVGRINAGAVMSMAVLSDHQLVAAGRGKTAVYDIRKMRSGWSCGEEPADDPATLIRFEEETKGAPMFGLAALDRQHFVVCMSLQDGRTQLPSWRKFNAVNGKLHWEFACKPEPFSACYLGLLTEDEGERFEFLDSHIRGSRGSFDVLVKSSGRGACVRLMGPFPVK